MEESLTLARPEELRKKSTIALHLLVKNGESVVGRLIGSLVPHISEVVAVVNDSTDKTAALLYLVMDWYDLRGKVIEVTAETHPQHYILDVAETYRVGQPLVGEAYEGPFTGRPLLADWAAVRNLGWNACVSDWRLFLDADDVLEDPENLPGACAALAERGVDLAASRYKYGLLPSGVSRGEGVRERLARNVPYIQWRGRVHETLAGATRRALLQGSIVVRDMRDSTGEGLRAPGRNFKVLYHHARVSDWDVSPRDLLYMAVEIWHSMPMFAKSLINAYLERSTWAEERAWACCVRGEICEAEQDYDVASGWYEEALLEFPKSSKAAFRLCRSRFREHEWQQSIDAYRLGVENELSTVQQLDDGEVYADASKILVAACLRKLGKKNEAVAMCEEALKSFPSNETIMSMLAGLKSSRE